MWAPQSTPQFLALLSQADELFYGGAAGGGKSDLLLGLAFTAHQDSIIFRREYKQFTGSTGLIDRSKEIAQGLGRYNGMEMTWRGLPGKRSLEFGAVQYEKDVVKYRGRPHDLVAFDELSEFTEKQYRFLIGWARTTDPNQRVRVVGAGNPPSHQEGRWVIKYWGPWLDRDHPNPAKPGELRWFAVLDGEDTEVDGPEPFEHNNETIIPKSRTFIPALLKDNPFLRDGTYEQQLQGLPEPLRSQLLYADFNIGIEDDPWQTIPSDWVLLAQARWRERDKPDTPLSAIGVDVARGGGDTTTIAFRYDNWFDEIIEHPGTATPDGPTVAYLVVEAMMDNDIEVEIEYSGDEVKTVEAPEIPIYIDVIGIGSSVYDTMVGWGLNAVPVNAAASSSTRDRSGMLPMRNLRAELWWGMREALDPIKGDDIALPDDDELRADLCTPKWKPTTSGILIESKEDIKKRLGRSTNKGDAAVQARMSEPRLLW